MTKGSHRRCKTRFRIGDKHAQPDRAVAPTGRLVVRPDTEDLEDLHVTRAGEIFTRDLNGEVLREACVLRPRPSTATKTDNSYFEYLNEVGNYSNNNETSNLYGLLHLEKTTELFNNSYRHHRHYKNKCDGGLTWDYTRCVNRGVCKEMSLKCNKCDFKSGYPCPLYHNDSTYVKGRPAAAAPNKSLQVALARQGIGPKGLIDLIHGLHMEAPALSGLYKSGARTTDILVKANRKDMSSKLQEAQQTNVRMGRPKHLISLEADGMYNNPISSGAGKTPFQAASQATFIGVENVTRNKYIVHAGTYNKLCHCCSFKGQHDHANCTRNLNPEDTIGNEGQFFKNAVADINAKDCYVSHVTLDGDSNTNKVAKTLEQTDASNNPVEIEVHRCVRHLSQSIRQQIRNLTLSKNAFPAAKTAEQRAVVQRRFALDIVLRCNAEATSIIKEQAGDKASIIHRFKFVPDYVLSCYMGDCTGCLQRSRICTRKKPWHRPYLSTMKAIVVTRDILEPSEPDLTSLRQCLEKRFSNKSLSTYLSKTTNKSEGTNRAILKSIPRHITFSRCFPGRVHAAVHSVNNKCGLSMLKLCRAVGATLPNQLVSQLKRSDKRDDYIKKYKKSCLYKQKLRQRIHELYALYDDKKEKQHYSKFMVDRSDPHKAQSSDHAHYTLRPSKSKK